MAVYLRLHPNGRLRLGGGGLLKLHLPDPEAASHGSTRRKRRASQLEFSENFPSYDDTPFRKKRKLQNAVLVTLLH